MLPSISVITVVRNAVETIEKALCSVFDQHYENVEYIVIDGGSTDGTVDIIKKYASQLAYWQSQPDKGAGFAQNIGLEHATSDIVAFLFADDWYENNILHLIGKTFAENPDLDVVSCACKIVSMQNKNPKTIQHYATKQDLNLNLQNVLHGRPLIGARFFRRTFLERIGHFIPADNNGKHNYTNDTDLLLRAILASPQHALVSTTGYVYLAHPNSFNFKRDMNNIKRVRLEHIAMSERYLKTNISAAQKKILINWQRDQWMRLVFCELYSGQWCQAMLEIKKAFQLHHFKLLRHGVQIPLQVFMRRLGLI